MVLASMVKLAPTAIPSINALSDGETTVKKTQPTAALITVSSVTAFYIHTALISDKPCRCMPIELDRAAG